MIKDLRRGLSLDRLFSFLQVAEAGGIAQATRSLPVRRRASRQSQLSRQIGELEGHFGKALVTPHGRARVLTPEGEKLATLAREIIAGLAGFTSGEDAPSRFELGAGDSLLQWWVLPRVHAVLARVPSARLTLTSLSSDDILARLRDARLDVGIVRQSERPKGTELRTAPLGSLEYALFVSKARMAKAGARTTEEVLAKVPIALQRSDRELNECLDPHVDRAAILECETFPQACRAVRSGQYASLLPVLVRGDLPAKEFAELALPGFKRLAARMLLAWHPRVVRQRGLAEAFVDALASELRM